MTEHERKKLPVNFLDPVNPFGSLRIDGKLQARLLTANDWGSFRAKSKIAFRTFSGVAGSKLGEIVPANPEMSHQFTLFKHNRCYCETLRKFSIEKGILACKSDYRKKI
jgi:hypothetical protein